MPDDPPFLTEAAEAGQRSGGQAPDALFDLAVNRAAAAVRGMSGRARASALAAWHARTRFARRVPLAAVQAALTRHPGTGEWHWAGGPGGGWQPGKAPFP
ncbi:hypothetical protein SAMN04488058_101551 [Deinococcus reticulitermitis]|uniref:Uncharacterized protein n=1 Tax=Deinococcus reticulitermitis TaxID=856736 RepID=A0A1H6TJK1_9DEIO|nr:hypothetical protein [Deinococcus reticulitermitis]SEI76430.1 hypothetical protein SAMN04488058_101551 [Deinococcus reticulitermitis]